MKIHIGTSIGTGETELSAFDTALYNAGIANYNLLYLSSVIPPRVNSSSMTVVSVRSYQESGAINYSS